MSEQARPGGVATDGAPGYRPTRTFSFATEFRRQASRRRTQLALGLITALPLIMLIAFQLDTGEGDDRDGGGGEFSALAELATSGGLNFAAFSLFVSAGFLLVVVAALFFGDTVASEAGWGSLRYLLAIPVPRARLLGVKLLVAWAYTLLAMLLLVGTGLLVGTARYGWSPFGLPIGGQLTTAEGIGRLAAIAGYIAVSLLVVSGLAFLLSVSTDNPLGAVGGAVLLNIISAILNQIDALGDLRTYLPTHYANAWLGLLSTPAQTDDVVRGCVQALCFATAFFALGFWRFIRKDVVS